MQKEKIALIALVIIVVAALSVFIIAVNTDIFENLFVEKQTIEVGDCANVSYIGKYASNNTVFDSSYADWLNKTGDTPLLIFVSYNVSETSPKVGYNAELIKGFMDGLIGLKEGQTKTIGPIPPEDAYGARKFTVGSIFTTSKLAFGMNQTVEVTNYTSENISFKWINMENLGNFTMPQMVINNLLSENETEMVIYPPPGYLWENSTTIINITENNVTVLITPTKSENLSAIVQQARYGEKQMLIFPNLTTAVWNDTTITVTGSPAIGSNYTFPTTDSYGSPINVTITVQNVSDDLINVSIISDQAADVQYLEVNKTLVFNRTFVLPRVYKDIPVMYIAYFYELDIQNAGYSLSELAGETLLFEVTIEKVYKTSQETS
jgi:FKBP-type peptidyl-prolyl cis-trans isomerase 2